MDALKTRFQFFCIFSESWSIQIWTWSLPQTESSATPAPLLPMCVMTCRGHHLLIVTGCLIDRKSSGVRRGEGGSELGDEWKRCSVDHPAPPPLEHVLWHVGEGVIGSLCDLVKSIDHRVEGRGELTWLLINKGSEYVVVFAFKWLNDYLLLSLKVKCILRHVGGWDFHFLTALN